MPALASRSARRFFKYTLRTPGCSLPMKPSMLSFSALICPWKAEVRCWRRSIRFGASFSRWSCSRYTILCRSRATILLLLLYTIAMLDRRWRCSCCTIIFSVVLSPAKNIGSATICAAFGGSISSTGFFFTTLGRRFGATSSFGKGTFFPAGVASTAESPGGATSEPPRSVRKSSLLLLLGCSRAFDMSRFFPSSDTFLLHRSKTNVQLQLVPLRSNSRPAASCRLSLIVLNEWLPASTKSCSEPLICT